MIKFIRGLFKSKEPIALPQYTHNELFSSYQIAEDPYVSIIRVDPNLPVKIIIVDQDFKELAVYTGGNND